MAAEDLNILLGDRPIIFGEVLARLRKRGNLSIRAMGASVDVDAPYILRLESGEKTNPSKRTIGRLALALMRGNPTPNIWELAELYLAADTWPPFLDKTDLKVPEKG